MVALAQSVATDATAEADMRGVRRWLLFLIFLVFAMVMVGGATRLTESGLSITEWNLVGGTVPPLSADAWQAEFDLYRQSPQYEILNEGMSLSAFKTIFWWEWAHRELGRFIGLVYIAGFLWFVGRRSVPLKTALVLAGVGVLLGAQGVVGWIMVASGLKPGMISVAPVKLTLHLTLASLLLGSLVTLFVRFGGAAREIAPPGSRFLARAIVLIAFVQVALGGLVAGNDAGLVYDTWPLMDGRLVPNGMGLLNPFWTNFTANATTIQFNHRIGGYILAATIFAYTLGARRGVGSTRGRAWLMAALVFAQVALGVSILLQTVPMELALAHQAVAMILLIVVVWNAAVFRRPA